MLSMKSKSAPSKVQITAVRPFQLLADCGPDEDRSKVARRVVQPGETIEIDNVFAHELVGGGKARLNREEALAVVKAERPGFAPPELPRKGSA